MKINVIDEKGTSCNLRRLLAERDYTPKQIACCLGFADNTAVYKWLSGKAIPKIDNLVALSGILNCHVEDILAISCIGE